MSDRINTITVVLDREVRDDDCEDILTALRMVKGVLSATPNVADLGEHMAIARARRELQQKLWDALKPGGYKL